MQIILGVIFHFIGGFASGSFYMPFKKVEGWAWESYWIIGGIFSWLIVPPLAAWLTLPGFSEIIRNASVSSIQYTVLFGVLWGIGGLTYGLGVRYLGMSLGNSVVLGFCSAFGAIVRSIYYAIVPTEGKTSIGEMMTNTWGQGVLLVLYRNQINKLANAIKEIIQGIKLVEHKEEPASMPHKLTARQIVPTTFTTSLPSAIKVQVIDRQRPNIYLAWTSGDLKEQREEMAIILQKAGFNVLPSIDCPADDETFKSRVVGEIDRCACSLHMLSGEFGRRFEANEEISFPQYQFLEARKRLGHDDSFNSFIWLYPESSQSVKPAQQNFFIGTIFCCIFKAGYSR